MLRWKKRGSLFVFSLIVACLRGRNGNQDVGRYGDEAYVPSADVRFNDLFVCLRVHEMPV